MRTVAYGRFVTAAAAAILLAGLASIFLLRAAGDEALLAGLAYSGVRNLPMGGGMLIVWLTGIVAGCSRLSFVRHRDYLNLKYHGKGGEDRNVPGVVLALFLSGVMVQMLLAYMGVRFMTGAMPDGGHASFPAGLMFAAAALASIAFWVYELSIVSGDLSLKGGRSPESPRRPFLPGMVSEAAGSFYSVFAVVLVWNGLMLPNAERYILSAIGAREFFNLLVMGAAYLLLLMPVFRYSFLEKAVLFRDRRFGSSPFILLSVVLSTVFALSVLIEF